MNYKIGDIIKTNLDNKYYLIIDYQNLYRLDSIPTQYFEVLLLINHWTPVYYINPITIEQDHELITDILRDSI
jgi:hypothetical protein